MKTQSIFLYGFFIALGIVGAAMLLQFTKGIIPCPLCMVQRLAFLGLAFLCGLGALLYRVRFLSAMLSLLAILFSFIGLIASGRQIWMQHFLTESKQECSASISYLLHVLPPLEVLKKIFESSAECSEKGFTILYLTLADWAFLWFAIFFCFAIYLLIRTTRK